MSKKKLVEFALDNGTNIIVESTSEENGIRRVSANDEPEKSSETFEAVINRIKPAAEAVLTTLKELNAPSEVGIEFGLKLSATTGVIIASADSEVNFKVSLKWVNPND